MDSCYYYREYKLPKGNLDSTVDCTYVLIMHDSPREDQIYQHIMKAEPTSRVFFQYNFGYKKCNKSLRENKPNIDLEDAYKTAFKHALERGCKRILVLEDDCEFDERIRDPEIVEDLNTFFTEKNPDIYNLGTTFGFPLPTDVIVGKTHQLLMYNSASHAVIYNDKYMNFAIENNFLGGHSDFETNRHLSKYTYKFPLAYQKVVETENAKEGWGSAYFLLDNLIVKPSGIDKIVQPGYDNIKKAYDYISVICFVLSTLLTVYLIKMNIRKST